MRQDTISPATSVRGSVDGSQGATGIRRDAPGVLKRVVGVYACLLVANGLVWIWAFATYHAYPKALGIALLAYTFGLRHAVDADHIAAIDNVTRKLMQTGKRPVTVGLFFSLGHSTVVILASIAIAATAAAVGSRFAALKDVGGLIGTAISAAFLFAIALANIFIVVGLYKTFHRVKAGGAYVEGELDAVLANRGLLTRLFRPVFAIVRESWHMYPLGFLFGLGFDTATEIGVLGMAAAAAAQGLSIWSILVYPALFTAGMTLIDTTDSILMLGAYGWAFVKPLRKLYYNMTITLVSALVAVVIGAIEALGVVGDRFGLKSGFWTKISALNDNFGVLGGVIIAVFAVSWLVSAAIYRLKGYDRVEGMTA